MADKIAVINNDGVKGEFDVGNYLAEQNLSLVNIDNESGVAKIRNAEGQIGDFNVGNFLKEQDAKILMPNEAFLTKKQFAAVQSAKQSENSGLAKATNFVNAPLRLLGIERKPFSAELASSFRNSNTRKEQGQGILRRTAGVIKDDLKETAKQEIGNIARVAPLMIPAGQGGLLLQSAKAALTIGGFKGIEELAEGEGLTQSAKTAVTTGIGAGLLTGTFGAGFKGIRKLSEYLSPVVKKSASSIFNALSGVPKESIDRAITKEVLGKSVFKSGTGPKVYEELGDKAQAAFNYLKQTTGRNVGLQKTLLKKGKEKVSTKPIVRMLDRFKKTATTGRVTSIKGSDIKKIDKVRQTLMNLGDDATLAELDIVKGQIDEVVRFSKGTQTVEQQITKTGENILKRTRNSINKLLRKKSPTFAKANDEFSKTMDIFDDIKTKLKDQNVAKSLKRLFTGDEATREVFQELDHLAPKQFKFMDKLQDSLTKEAFSKGIGKNQLGKATAIITAAVANPTALLGAPLLSPKGQELLIRGAAKLPKVAKALSPPLKQFLAVKNAERMGEVATQSVNNLLYGGKQ